MIQTEPILSNVRKRLDQQSVRLAERGDWLITAPHRKSTDAEAWERFVSEYKPLKKSSGHIKHNIETGKYGLDTVLFAIDRFVNSIANHADFSFDQGSLSPVRATSVGRSQNYLSVKLDLNIWQGSKPYVGVRIIIPVGN